jgi:hypothetical protein
MVSIIAQRIITDPSTNEIQATAIVNIVYFLSDFIFYAVNAKNTKFNTFDMVAFHQMPLFAVARKSI